MDVRVGLSRKLKTWYFWTVVLEKTLESLLDCKEIQPVYPKGDQSWVLHWKDWCWGWNSNTLDLMWRVDSLEKTLMLGGIGGRRRGDDRGGDGWMASPTQCTRVWVNSGSWWWTGRPGVLRFMGSQRVGHDWGTELNWTKLKILYDYNIWVSILQGWEARNLFYNLMYQREWMKVLAPIIEGLDSEHF